MGDYTKNQHAGGEADFDLEPSEDWSVQILRPRWEGGSWTPPGRLRVCEMKSVSTSFLGTHISAHSLGSLSPCLSLRLHSLRAASEAFLKQ